MKDKKYQPDGDESKKQDRIVDLDSGIVYKTSAGATSGNSMAKNYGPSGTNMDRTPERRPQSGSDTSNGPYYSSQTTAGTTANTPDISPPNYRRQAPGPGPGNGQAPPLQEDRMGNGFGPSSQGIAYTERNYESPYTRTRLSPRHPREIPIGTTTPIAWNILKALTADQSLSRPITQTTDSAVNFVRRGA
jgi:hypothetical protein